MMPTHLRSGAIVAMCAAAFALSACGAADPPDAASTSSSGLTSSTSTSQSTSSTSRTPTSSTTSAPTTSTAQTTSAPPSPTTAAAPVGPQQCGQVTTVTGALVPVRIVSGDVDCAFAEGLLGTYYGEPAKLQGSGGFREIGEWSCISATVASGGGTTCSTADGEITTGPSAGDPSAPMSTSSTSAAPGPTEGSCDLIDQPTLEQMFPDGVQDEQKCANFIRGEAAH